MTMDELRKYASAKTPDINCQWEAALCHGHAEIEVPGVEVTTGPLGQGIANALLDYFFEDILTTADGCLQGGVAQEEMAIADHLGLDNWIPCYDNNQVACDSPLSWTVSKNMNAKMRALGWNVIDVWDGDNAVEEILAAMRLVQMNTPKNPTFTRMLLDSPMAMQTPSPIAYPSKQRTSS
ncbi:hypothetical protein APSETT444_009392 [Aspergillus pseudonomiae]